MKAASIVARWRPGGRGIQLLRWGALFFGLLLALWAATQSSSAPQSILVLVLHVLALSFGSTGGRGGASVIPVVSLSSLFVTGYEASLLLVLLGAVLAELTLPLWGTLWESGDASHRARTPRLATALVAVVALAIGGAIYRQTSPLPISLGIDLGNLWPLLALGGSYAVSYLIGNGAIWLLAGGSRERTWWDFGADVVVAGLLSQPFAYFGAIVYFQVGLPAFALFCLGVGAYAIVAGLSWRRQFTMEQQLRQFAALNRVGRSMRETLELRDVLLRTHRQVTDLVPADAFTIALRDVDGGWRRALHALEGSPVLGIGPGEDYAPDGFTRWVVEQGRVLDLNPDNMHYAGRHHIAGPDPLPAAWLGVPLTTAGKTIGAMILERTDPLWPFSRWSREVLLAAAGQASAAIENARLYSEVVRLLNRTDEALSRRVDQLQALLDAVGEAVIMLDERGRVLLVNRRAIPLLGEAQVVEPVHELDLALTAPRLGYEESELTALLDGLAKGALPPGRSLVFAASAADDRRRYLERVEAPVVDRQGTAIGWLMVFRDVTEERELAAWRQDVTRMIVHDLRNPVTTLLSTLARMERRPDAEDAAPDLLPRARRSGHDLLDMIDSLMDIQRMEAGRLVVDAEAMRLPALAEQVVEHLSPLAEERGVSLLIGLADGLPAVWADAALLRRVMRNLLDNALKFSPAGGQIVVTMQEEAGQDGREPGLRCAITDEGPGIPPHHRQRIFDRYTRLDAGGGAIRGTGLGLTFCKLAIEAQGGEVWVEDAPGGGSRFVFTLPGLPRP